MLTVEGGMLNSTGTGAIASKFRGAK